MTVVLSSANRASKVFAVDANIFICAHRDDYPPDIFPGVWIALERAGRQGLIVTTPQVYEEVREPPDLKRWMRAHKEELVVDMSGSDVREAFRAATTWVDDQPRFSADAREEFNGSADLELIAVALAHGLVVMTNERPAARSSTVKIPDVCAAFDIEVASLLDLFRWVGIKFGEVDGTGTAL